MNAFNKILLLVLLFIVGSVGFFVARQQSDSFEKLNSKEMNKRIIAERDFAIKKAVKAGDYRCCINPPCTMCYMQANKWNNFKAGTCACDDLLAQGKEACPECKSGLCEQKDEGSCKLDLKKYE